MKFEFDGKAFSKQLKQKRIIDLDIDLRTAATKTGLSAATISRCEHGKEPKLTTYFTLCKWLGTPVNQFIKTVK